MASEDANKLKTLSDSIHSSIIDLLKNSQKILKIGKFTSLAGALIASGASLISTYSGIDDSLKSIFVMAGVIAAILAIAGVGVQFILEDDTAELVSQSRQGLEQAQLYLANRQALSSRIIEMEELDTRGRDLFTAMMWAFEHAEIHLDGKRHDIETLITSMINSCRSSILGSIGVSHSDKYSLTVYKVDHNSRSEPFLHVLVNSRPNVSEQSKPAREWKLGEGYSGQAWLTRKPVIIEDSLNSSSGYFPFIPDEKQQGNGTANLLEDLTRYRSAASAPICLGDTNEVWGVVTVTLDRPHAFSEKNPSASQRQSVKTVDALAQMIALFVAVSTCTNTTTGEEGGGEANGCTTQDTDK